MRYFLHYWWISFNHRELLIAVDRPTNSSVISAAYPAAYLFGSLSTLFNTVLILKEEESYRKDNINFMIQGITRLIFAR